MTPRVLLVDNYDSFTYNLFHLIASAAGVEPVVVRNDEPVPPGEWTHIVLSPGPGRPDIERDFGVCSTLIREARVPLLGVCLGHQGLCGSFGAAVIQSSEPAHGMPDEILHTGTSIFEAIPQRFRAIRYHSLEVVPPLPDCLELLAWNAEGTVMAVRHRERPLFGVQFHPESAQSEYGAELMRNFLSR